MLGCSGGRGCRHNGSSLKCAKTNVLQQCGLVRIVLVMCLHILWHILLLASLLRQYRFLPIYQ
ncbi:hypothetical protein PSEUDO8BK_40842 [Pseudomonas sp. 8BK]|nr:hypothetical protein PSEUDO8BK_40842 [Pseudomonas sp. 8BK]